jgi:hypothetical protein
VILALVTATYEAAIIKARQHGALDPRLFILMDEAANIAPVRNLAPWLSQCGDHGIVIATTPLKLWPPPWRERRRRRSLARTSF